MSWTVTYCECIWEYEQVLNRLTTHVFTYVHLKIYIKHYAVCSSQVFCRIFAFFCCCCSARGQRKIRLTAYVFFWFSRAVITVWQLPMTCVEIVWGLKKNYTSGYLLLQVIPVKVCVCVCVGQHGCTFRRGREEYNKYAYGAWEWNAPLALAIQ